MKIRIIGVMMIGLCAVLLMGALAIPAAADDGYKIISTPDLIEWLASEVEYNEERISGSVCIPAEIMKDSDRMPRDRDTPIVFYCHGPG